MAPVTNDMNGPAIAFLTVCIFFLLLLVLVFVRYLFWFRRHGVENGYGYGGGKGGGAGLERGREMTGETRRPRSCHCGSPVGLRSNSPRKIGASGLGGWSRERGAEAVARSEDIQKREGRERRDGEGLGGERVNARGGLRGEGWGEPGGEDRKETRGFVREGSPAQYREPPWSSDRAESGAANGGNEGRGKSRANEPRGDSRARYGRERRVGFQDPPSPEPGVEGRLPKTDVGAEPRFGEDEPEFGGGRYEGGGGRDAIPTSDRREELVKGKQRGCGREPEEVEKRPRSFRRREWVHSEDMKEDGRRDAFDEGCNHQGLGSNIPEERWETESRAPRYGPHRQESLESLQERDHMGLRSQAPSIISQGSTVEEAREVVGAEEGGRKISALKRGKGRSSEQTREVDRDSCYVQGPQENPEYRDKFRTPDVEQCVANSWRPLDEERGEVSNSLPQ